MDKKLVSILIFGIFAISLANILLSIGIVSLLLVDGFSGSGQPSGSTTDSMAFSGTNSTVPVSRMTDQLLAGDANPSNASAYGTNTSAVSPANTTSVAKPAAGDLPFDASQLPSGSMPTPPDGSMLSGGQPPSGGQMLSGGQMSSGTSQGTTGSMPGTTSAGQAATTTGQYPSTAGSSSSQMSGNELISSLLQQSGLQGISTDSSPVVTTSPSTTSWVFNGSAPFGK